jgi:hypothetical protein
MQRKPARPQGQADPLWNALSVLTFLAAGVVIVAFVLIYRDPNQRLNPFPPPTLIPTLFVPTYTPFDTPAPVTPSPTFTVTSTATLTPLEPTSTVTVTPTETLTPTLGPSPTATINSAYPFILRGDPVAIASSAIPGHEECKLWVAGQAYDLQNAPMVGITVQLGGYLGKTVSQFSLTGTALQYGPAGYEFTVANLVQGSENSIWIMLLDQAGVPLSNRIYLNTYDDCQRNLILVNFRQIR